ncbi:MAG: 30S ribosomal protein S18 [Bifidobacteriaceae bacterium]|jgi:small subunit ribosomal protein S18|nr:30S ribosomal protein S18 [Bifidobacteriaceae bacterium]
MKPQKKSKQKIEEATSNLLTDLKVKEIDYKDIDTLNHFISNKGKIRSRKTTGVTVQQQRRIATAIKRARFMALMPFASNGKMNKKYN